MWLGISNWWFFFSLNENQAQMMKLRFYDCHGFQPKKKNPNFVNICLPLYVTQVSCHMLAKLKLSWKTNSNPMQQLLALHEFHNCAYFLEKKVFKKSKFLKKNISKEKKPWKDLLVFKSENGFCNPLRRFWMFLVGLTFLARNIQYKDLIKIIPLTARI